MKAKRKLQPRPLVSAAPIGVSDQTCFDLVGLTVRQFRDFLSAHPEIPRTVIGQRVVVRADVLLAALERLGSPTKRSAGTGATFSDSEPAASIDAVLAAVGRRRAF